MAGDERECEALNRKCFCEHYKIQLSLQDYAGAFASLNSSFRALVLSKIIELPVSDSSVADQSDVISTIDLILGRVNELIGEAIGPENRMLRITADKQVYLGNEKARIKIEAKTAPENSENEFSVTLRADGRTQRTELVSENEWIAVAEKLLPGTHTFEATVSIRNRREATNLRQAISVVLADVHMLEKRLEEETDPEIIENLQNQLVRKRHQISILKARLTALERQLDGKVKLKILVN